MAHPVWTDQEVNSVARTHKKPANLTDYTALSAVRLCKFLFDSITFFKWGTLTEKKVLNRAIFLETVAAVPGMVIMPSAFVQTYSCGACLKLNVSVQTAGMLRHLRSLRRMDRDHGWIHTLLEEAENERMHLLTFLKLRRPGPLFRLSVVLTQVKKGRMSYLTFP